MFVEYNPNPLSKRAGDCVIRAVTKVMDIDWDKAYLGIIMQGYSLKDMPSINHVWGQYLKEHGFSRHAIPDTCPECYTIADFASEHKTGKYILATGSHVVAVVDGDYYDTWDSGEEVPMYYFEKEEEAWQDNGETTQVEPVTPPTRRRARQTA